MLTIADAWNWMLEMILVHVSVLHVENSDRLVIDGRGREMDRCT